MRHPPFPHRLIALTIWIATCVVSGNSFPHAAHAQTGLAPLEDFDYWLRLCQLQTDTESYEDALASCEQAIVLKPKDATLWLVHSEILLNLEQYSAAIVSAERAIALDSESSLAIIYQCQAYSDLGQAEVALEICNQAAAIEAAEEEIAIEETAEAETTEEIAEAESEGTAIEVSDDSDNVAANNETAPLPVIALREQGNALEAAGDFEAALGVYQQLQLINPADAISLAYKCRTQVALQLYTSAVATCQQVIDGDGPGATENQGFALYYQGLALAGLGKHQEAIAAYDQSLALSPEDAEIWIAQGISLQAQSQHVAALTSYARATELDPTSSRSLLGQCIAQNYLLDYETAAASCQQAIEQGDNKWFAQREEEGEAEAWNQWGRALSGQDMHAEALVALERALGMRPRYREAWSNQSVVYWFLGNIAQAKADTYGAIAHYTAAIESVERALEITAGTPAPTAPLSEHAKTQRNTITAYAYANLGRYQRTLAQLYSQTNSPRSAAQRFTGALTAYNQALELTPDDAETWVNRSVVLWFLGSYEGARASAGRAVTLDANLVAAWQAQAVALVALGDLPAARISYQQALLRDNQNADAWAGLGIVSLQLQDRETGIMALQKALAINPAQSVALSAIALLSEE